MVAKEELTLKNGACSFNDEDGLSFMFLEKRHGEERVENFGEDGITD